MSGYRAYWDGEGEDFDTTYIMLNVLAYRGAGIDETRVDYDDVSDQLRTTVAGVRLFTLSIRAKSYDMSEPGYEIIERIRRRLRGGAARAVLESEGLAITKVTNPITDLNTIADNRPIYDSVWDLGMSFAVNEIDVQPLGGGDYIVDAPTVGTVSDGTDRTINVDPVPGH